jgi:hypothetical protein
MELEIKHLAPYLPYRIDAEMLDYKIDYVGKQFDTIIGVEQWSKNGVYWSAITVGGSKPNIRSVKPILRPLSSLTELMANQDVSYVSYLWNEIIATDDDSFDKDDFYENCCLCSVNYLPIIVIDKLLEWKFDIFDLITNNLAIDINTIKL